MNGLYADLLQEVKSKGTITNAFGIERTFLGDPKDSGTLREIAGYVGQSDTAGNMNRSQYEIDHGYIPANFRDGVNPDARDEPRKMDWKSHGFRFLLQTHDSFTVERSEEHTSELQSLMRITYAVFCFKKKTIQDT